jgi:hypothetical protein
MSRTGRTRADSDRAISTYNGPPGFSKADAHRCRIAYQAVQEGIDKQFDYRA